MTEAGGFWVAVSAGVLDVREHELGSGVGGLLVTPLVPGEPLLLRGEGEALWRRLVEMPLSDDLLSDAERETILDMADMGLASQTIDHPRRVDHVSPPWLVSPLHELVYALLAHVAAENDIEILFIKGPTLHAQGLRDRAHSGDVDCWVPRGDDIRLARAMQAWGWSPAFSALTGTDVLHSLTLRGGTWGSAVDVHSWFPGMVLDASDAFRIVSERSEHREFAGVEVRTPTRVLHAIISALHDLRPYQGHHAGDSQVREAAATLRNGGEEVLEGVLLTNSAYALDLALRQAFPSYEQNIEELAMPRDWPWRLASSPLKAYVEAIKIVPMRQRPRVIFRVLWPTTESLISGPMADADASPLRIRWRRVMQGWKSLRVRGRE